jgi:hypothetical protein
VKSVDNDVFLGRFGSFLNALALRKILRFGLSEKYFTFAAAKFKTQ